jgi:hypothetical protein
MLIYQFSLVAMDHEDADNIIDLYLEWIIIKRLDRMIQFANAGKVLWREFINIDLIKD